MMSEVNGVRPGVGPEDGAFIASASNNDIDGGAGFDMLFLGGLQGSSNFLWNAPGHSGGVLFATDLADGRTLTITFKDIESIVGSPA